METTEDVERTDKYVKPELRVGSRTCQCADCLRFFAGVRGFDQHHVGSWKNRRCRTDKEMEKIGMVQNPHGVWLTGTVPGKPRGRRPKAA